MLGVNIESGRVRDIGDVKVKTAFRKIVDTYPTVDFLLTPSQSVVFKNIEAADKESFEKLLTDHGVKMIQDIDQITRTSLACPAFPLCGLAMTEAERVQPEMNSRIWTLLNKMDIANAMPPPMVRTTGCPNGCARPY